MIHNRGPLLEENHYGSWGLKLSGISSLAAGKLINRYKYNGKELQSCEFSDGSGLELYDYGARMQDPQLGRWNGIDKLTGEYSPVSPYAYCANNPVKYIDLDGERLYFSAGAGHDADKTGYIEKMLSAFAQYGNIHQTKDIDAHTHGFLGSQRDALWSIGEYRDKPYYQLNKIYSGFGGDGVSSKVNDDDVDWRIKSTVEQIEADRKAKPLQDNEQFNLAGYSTGAVIMAQSALMLANKGQTIDNLILIGATFDKNSDLSSALAANKNIKNIIRIDIPGDNVVKGIGALGSFLEKGNGHPHFAYAFGENADENRKALSMILESFGVGDYKKKEDKKH